MTSQENRQGKSTFGLPAPKPTSLPATKDDSLRIVRLSCKARVYNWRGVLLPSPNDCLMRLPKCAVCGEYVREPSMHEVFITRGHVRGLEPELQAMIFVPENVALVHEGKCHRYAQHYEEGKRLCALNIIKHHKLKNVVGWLDSLPFTRAEEERRYIIDLCNQQE